MKKGGKDPVRFADILAKSLRRLGWSRILTEQAIISRWEEAVGPQIARRCRPLYLKDGRLTIVVDSPAWAQQLALLKRDLIGRFDTIAGKGAVRDLFFTTGDVSSEESVPPSPPVIDTPLSPETEEAIEREAAAIADEELREAFSSLLRTASRRGKPPPQAPPRAE